MKEHINTLGTVEICMTQGKNVVLYPNESQILILPASDRQNQQLLFRTELFHMVYNNIIARVMWELESTVHGVGWRDGYI